MVVDNEDQKKLILNLISLTKVEGNLEQAEKLVAMLKGLKEATEKAEIR